MRDDGFIRKDIGECGRLFNVREVRFDPYRALLLVNELVADGFNLVEHRQGFISMTDPVDAVLNMVKKADFEHGGNPVLTWMADNLVVVADAAGNKKAGQAIESELAEKNRRHGCFHACEGRCGRESAASVPAESVQTMSSQPQQFPASPQVKKEELQRKQERAARRSDYLYFAGAALVTAGAARSSLRAGFITAGAFLLLLPLLELVGSFIRGLRGPQRGR